MGWRGFAKFARDLAYHVQEYFDPGARERELEQQLKTLELNRKIVEEEVRLEFADKLTRAQIESLINAVKKNPSDAKRAVRKIADLEKERAHEIKRVQGNGGGAQALAKVNDIYDAHVRQILHEIETRGEPSAQR